LCRGSSGDLLSGDFRPPLLPDGIRICQKEGILHNKQGPYFPLLFSHMSQI
jgi:hypothetical protein